MLVDKIFDGIVVKGADKIATRLKPKKKPVDSLVKELISNPDLAEISIKKEGTEIVIRIKKSENAQ